MSVPFEEIAAAALAHAPSLLGEMFPNGRQRGHEYVLGNLHGEEGESLSINMNTGKWADFAGDAKGGDLISLAAAALFHGNQKDAALELAERLGMTVNGGGSAPARRGAVSMAAKAIAPPKIAAWRPLPVPEGVAPPVLSGWDHVYVYRDPAGVPLRYILRRDAVGDRRKIFQPVTYGSLDGKLGWHRKHADEPRCLYGLDRLAAMPDVPALICEGEKDTDAAQALFPDRPCICWSNGTESVEKNDWSPIAGRRVVIWPDNDKPGVKATRQLVEILAPIAATVAVLRVDDLGEGMGAADVHPEDPKAWIRERLAQAPVPAAQGGDGPGDEEQGQAETQGNRKRASGMDPIKMRQGDIDLTVDAAEAALLKSQSLNVFQRGAEMVIPTLREARASKGRTIMTAGLNTLSSNGIVDLLSKAVEFRKFDKRSMSWELRDPPKQVAEIMLTRAHSWAYPVLAGIVTTPTLRYNGSLLSEPGFDQVTGLFHFPDPQLNMPAILARPTRTDAVAGLELLKKLLTNFPFVTDVDRAVALSAIITPIVRGALDAAPMHAFRAPSAGSGKSYLVDLISTICTGQPCPVLSYGKNEHETETRLGGVLLEGFPLISIDNVNGELGGDLLCMAIERPLISVRRLGGSDLHKIRNTVSFFATGNNLRVRGDMTRRTLIANLDAQVERPEARQFATDPIKLVQDSRGLYVAACLTIVRAFLVAKAPQAQPPLGSFGDWSGIVRSALVWLGEKDPCDSIEASRDEDPELIQLREVLEAWKASIGVGLDVTALEVVNMATKHKMTPVGVDPTTFEHPELNDAIMKIAKGTRGAIESEKFGYWLRSRVGKIADGLRIERAASVGHGKVAKWALVSSAGLNTAPPS